MLKILSIPKIVYKTLYIVSNCFPSLASDFLYHEAVEVFPDQIIDVVCSKKFCDIEAFR